MLNTVVSLAKRLNRSRYAVKLSAVDSSGSRETGVLDGCPNLLREGAFLEGGGYNVGPTGCLTDHVMSTTVCDG